MVSHSAAETLRTHESGPHRPVVQKETEIASDRTSGAGALARTKATTLARVSMVAAVTDTVVLPSAPFDQRRPAVTLGQQSVPVGGVHPAHDGVEGHEVGGSLDPIELDHFHRGVLPVEKARQSLGRDRVPEIELALEGELE